MSERRFYFRREQRLLTKKAFSHVFDNCSIRVGRGPILILATTNELDHARLGLVVRKKFIHSAVGRNSFKRIARECFRLQQHELGSMDIVVLNRSGSDTLTNPQLSKQFTKAFHALSKKFSEQV